MSATFTPGEAAAITELPRKRVYNELKRVIPSQSPHHLDFSALVYLRVLRSVEYVDRCVSFSVEGRIRLYREVVRALSAHSPSVNLGEHISIRLDCFAQEVRERLEQYREWEKTLVVDPAIMGGETVFSGTRLTVYHVGSLLNRDEFAKAVEAESICQELLEDYPELTVQDLDFARIYASAHPREGRPQKSHQIPA